jgi:hypothetical protein
MTAAVDALTMALAMVWAAVAEVPSSSRANLSVNYLVSWLDFVLMVLASHMAVMI